MHNDEINNQNDQSATTEYAESSELITCKQERDTWKDKFLRVQADFDNFTKRIDKERVSWKNTVQAAMLHDILPIVDDFDRALSSPHQNSEELKNWLSGFQMMHKSLQKLLEKYEVVEIPASMPFDPHYHEAIMQVVAPDKEPGAIVAILQKGYMCKGHVLRPAKVSVAQ